MTINGFTTKGKERELQTRKEQAKGRKTLAAEQRKGRNAAKLSAREQEKTLKDYYAKEKRLKELEKEDAVIRQPIPTDHWRKRPELIVRDDPNVVLPKAVQAVVDVANAYYEPHVSFSFNAEVLNLSRCDPRVDRIADGIAVAIKMVLAQHELRSRPINVHANTVAVPTKQKEVTNGE